MRRTQIQLDERTFEALRQRAFQERQSIAGVIREILREKITPGPDGGAGRRPFSFIGAGRSRGKGAGRISELHDEELANAVL